MAPSKQVLQKAMNIISAKLTELNFQLNPEKCKYVRFRKGSNLCNENITINGLEIKEVKSVKYLGIILTYNLIETDDIKRAHSSFLRQYYGFIRKFSKCNLYFLAETI